MQSTENKLDAEPILFPGNINALHVLHDVILKLIDKIEEPSFIKKYATLGTPGQDELRRDLPYALQPLGEDRYILVNRNYRPIGKDPSIGHVDYELFKNLHLHIKVKQKASRNEVIALYTDLTQPWQTKSKAKAYINRLRKLREECFQSMKADKDGSMVSK